MYFHLFKTHSGPVRNALHFYSYILDISWQVFAYFILCFYQHDVFFTWMDVGFFQIPFLYLYKMFKWSPSFILKTGLSILMDFLMENHPSFCKINPFGHDTQIGMCFGVGLLVIYSWFLRWYSVIIFSALSAKVINVLLHKTNVPIFLLSLGSEKRRLGDCCCGNTWVRSMLRAHGAP